MLAQARTIHVNCDAMVRPPPMPTPTIIVRDFTKMNHLEFYGSKE